MLHVYSLLLIVIGWGIFYFDDMGDMGKFFHAFAGGAYDGFDITVEGAVFDRFWLWIAAIIFCMPTRRFISSLPGRIMPESSSAVMSLSLVTRVVLSAAILLISVAMLVGATNNAFLYTRF